MGTPPWEGPWLRATPEKFELMVVEYLRDLGERLTKFEITHQTALTTPDGEFDMDALATFEALGAEFVVLVECKHHKNPIKRELVQVLADKLTGSRTHKGILFSTVSFQKGAVKFARARRIALVHFTEGGPVYEARAFYSPDVARRPYDAYLVTLTDTGSMNYRYGAFNEVKNLLLFPPTG